MLIQCCQCKRVRKNGVWSKRPKAPSANASHTYCPTCFEACREEFEQVYMRPILPRFTAS